jgi:hypothetical protein
MEKLIEFWRAVYEGLPPWPRVVMAFLMFFLGGFVVLLSIRNVIVYDVKIRNKNTATEPRPFLVTHNVGLEQPTGGTGWIRLALESFPVSERLGLSDQRNTMRIKIPVEPNTAPKGEARFEFTTDFWTSHMVNFELSCDFDAKPTPTCDLERAGDYKRIQTTQRTPGPVEFAVVRAEAAAPDPGGNRAEIVSSLETLQRSLPDGGFTEVRLSLRPAVTGYCKSDGSCPDVLYFDVEWNGRRWLFDGTEPVNSRERNVVVTSEGKMGDLVFGIQNNSFDGGANRLQVSAYSRGESRKSWVAQQPKQGKLVDTFTTTLELFCKPADRSLTGSSKRLQAALETKVRKDRYGRDHEVVVASGKRAAMEALVQAIGVKIDTLLTGPRDSIPSGTRGAVHSVVRPPSICRADPADRWTVVLGIGQPDGRSRILFTNDEARELVQRVRSQPRTLAELSVRPNSLEIVELHQR